MDTPPEDLCERSTRWTFRRCRRASCTWRSRFLCEGSAGGRLPPGTVPATRLGGGRRRAAQIGRFLEVPVERDYGDVLRVVRDLRHTAEDPAKWDDHLRVPEVLDLLLDEPDEIVLALLDPRGNPDRLVRLLQVAGEEAPERAAVSLTDLVRECLERAEDRTRNPCALHEDLLHVDGDVVGVICDGFEIPRDHSVTGDLDSGPEAELFDERLVELRRKDEP